MAKVYGEIDPLEKIICSLRCNPEAKHLRNLDEILTFRDFCELKVSAIEAKSRKEQNQILLNQSELISSLAEDYSGSLEKRKQHYKLKCLQLCQEIETRDHRLFRFLFNIITYFKLLFYRVFGDALARLNCRKSERQIKKEKNKFEEIKLNTENRVHENVESQAGAFLNALKILRSKNNLILGAIGEQRVVDELKKLPDTYTVINNFQLRLDKPIYNKRENQRIFSAQADHLVVGPSGVFLIETKNWSNETLRASSGFSPFDQIKRTSFALYCYINPKQKNSFFYSLFKSSPHKKVPLRSILVMVGVNVKEKDKFIKVLNLERLNGYITYFPKVFEKEDVSTIVDKFLKI